MSDRPDDAHDVPPAGGWPAYGAEPTQPAYDGPGATPYGTPYETPHGAPYEPPPYRSYANPYGNPYGAAPAGAYGLPYGDPNQLYLPEGVFIAPAGRRVGAFFLAIPLSIVTLGIGYLIWGLIVWGKGTSPALQVLGMRAWKQDQSRVAGWGDMALRNVLEWLVSNASCGIASLVSFVLFLSDEPRHRTIGDRIAGTVIVRDPYKRLG